MSVDFTARICDSCEHATVCPHRETFLAFYNNRDKVMVKCGTDDGEVDTSQTVTIRVQHRYLDGPGLEQLYHDYGLHDSCWFPCMAGFAGCPIMRHPFDSPIYSCYPNPAGYIPEICSGARLPNGDRIPFIAMVSTAETNEYYASPYNYQDKTIQDYPGLLWWTCKSCPHHTQCEEEFNFNDLGGTQFSTFGFTDVTVKLGEKVYLSDIPTPKNIIAGYTRADSNPEYFEVTDANSSFIIYYNYASEDGSGGDDGDGGDGTTPPIGTPDNPMSTNDIITSELLHTGAIFFNDKAYLYPKPEEYIPMKISINGIVCGTISRISDDGVKINPGDTMEVTVTENGAITALVTADETALETNAGELIDGDIAETNDTITTIESPVITLDPRYSYDISGGNYRAFALVENDILIIHLIYSGPYELDLDMMKMMNYGFELKMEKDETVIGLVHDVHLRVTVPNNDFTIQLCLKDVNYPIDEYPPIDYTPWSYDEIVWAYLPTRAINMDDEEVNVYQPMAPRKWSATMVNDLTPSYIGEVPPMDMAPVRPYFKLIGYATELSKRESYDPNITITSDTPKINIATAVRFLNSGEVGSAEVYRWLAMWRIRYQLCAELIEEQMPELFGNTFMEHVKIESDKCAITNSTQINSLRDPGLVDELQGQWSIKWFEYKKNYGENDLVAIYNKFMELNLPNRFMLNLYLLPAKARDFELKNKLNAENEDNLPDAVVPVWTGAMNEEGTEVINNHHLSEYLLTPETAENLMNMREGNTLTLLAVISPKNCAGLWAYDQSFISYQFTIYENTIGLTTTFIFDGKDMVYNGLPNLELMKGYILNGLLPEDAGHVFLHRENNVLSLSGDRAYLYKLLPQCDVKYQQIVTVKSRFTHVDCDVNTSTIAVTYRRGCEIDLKAPDGCSIKSITVDGHNLYEIINNERVINKFQTDDIDADMKVNDDDTITLYLNNVGKDINVLVMLKEGDDGSIVGCERCKGYVDASEYPWIKWYPVCDYYTPASMSMT